MGLLLGCGWGESSPELKGWRNGYRYRDLLTSQGRLEELKVPRDRVGHFPTQLFKQYHRAEAQLEEALESMPEDNRLLRSGIQL
jgi:transposase-like protein